VSTGQSDSVDAAHAVDRDFLDEELFGDDVVRGLGLVGSDVLKVVLFHAPTVLAESPTREGWGGVVILGDIRRALRWR